MYFEWQIKLYSNFLFDSEIIYLSYLIRFYHTLTKIFPPRFGHEKFGVGLQWLAISALIIIHCYLNKHLFSQLSRAVLKYHQEQRSKEVKAEKEESVRLRKIAASIAKEIKQFWGSVEKVFFLALLYWDVLRVLQGLSIFSFNNPCIFKLPWNENHFFHVCYICRAYLLHLHPNSEKKKQEDDTIL